MKNFKKVSVALLAVTCLTELTYPIILTGPGRRNMHRSQKEEAYKAGLMDGQRQEEYLDEDQNVQVQSIYDIEDINQDQYEPQTDTFIAPEYEVFDENYADDGSISIQAIGSGQFGGQIASQLTPEMKMQIMERISNRDEVKTQSIELGENDSEQPQNTIDPKVEEITIKEQVIAPAEESKTITISAEVLAEENNDGRKSESIVIPAELVTVPAVLPIIERVQEIKEVQTEPVAKIATESVVEKSESQPAQEVLEPAVTTEPVASAINEQIKIVKIYPVYEAARSAMHNVKTAAQDMVNYIYEFFAKKQKNEKQEDIIIQKLSGRQGDSKREFN